MSRYDALIAAWNFSSSPPATPPGISGTPLTGGMSITQKLNAVNGWTIAGASIKMVVPTYLIYNAILGTEFVALSAANQQLIRDILSMGTVDVSSGTQVRARIINAFPNGTTTFANLAALAAPFDSPQIPWWSAPAPLGGGLTSPVSVDDLIAAGGLS